MGEECEGKAEAMAENESLDLSYRNSARWRRICDRIPLGSLGRQAIVDAIDDALVKTYQNVAKGFPDFGNLGNAVVAGDAVEVDRLLRTCHKSRDYAELLMYSMRPGFNRENVITALLNATCDRFFDQYALRMVPDVFRSFHDWANYRRKLQIDLAPSIKRIAQQMSASRLWSTRSRPRSHERRVRQQEELLSMSLVNSGQQ
jgi:hypothetical protein